MSVNTLTAYDKYSLINTDSLTKTIQMHLFKTEKHFVNLFLWFWNVDLVFNILKKKDDAQSLCIFEYRDYERCGGTRARW